ncbi:endosomal/lysosomal potassium channel TMEM175 isoform X1 [Rousettus aegyptiacus]|uniref:Endosomal/lysosomal proton channel TMEM175 n=1 Tax=Rousettus aegyptiacus TaxID=9407 RepID=A0A7J8EBT8_ROUAE|nr:endosomal/lysosomal potassium channel TMEM175 isoform X1 [Rousettus aegyptiacus]XP_016014760.2 endosomal/lysosomal potassium channel TMEM175 isoform X1 [Rousettus aegyptiacus]KAF6432619.1 transmembrane protein 175 [Rousettus aegyptiacus]
MSRPGTPEPALCVQGDSAAGTQDEDAADGTQHSHRMLSFSDALLSIIATVMILPVTHTKISPEQQFDKSVQKLLATRIAVYLMTFLIVTVAWAAHTRLFQVVGKIDDTLALLNLACMMTITFLPFTFSLMVTFPEVPLGIFLFCMCVIAIGAVQALIVVYAFRFPHLLNPEIQGSAHRALYRRHVLHIVLRGPVLCLAAAGFSLFFYPASYLLMAMAVFLPYLSKAASWCRCRLLGPQEPPTPSIELFDLNRQEPLSKERVAAFSDGVYAIVATLLILDICEDNVPDAKDVDERFHGSLVAALRESGPRFLAYFGSFATVGLLWFAHHSLFLHVRKATQPMGLLNALSLAFVGGLPLAYQQTSAFARQPRDELARVRISCAIIFFASIFQFATWTAALLHGPETLQPSARFGGREHAFMFAKLALYPCTSLLAFASTCFLSRFSTAIFHLMQIAVPSAFLLLRLLVRLALALLQTLRGLARPARGAEEDVRAPLLPAPC